MVEVVVQDYGLSRETTGITRREWRCAIGVAVLTTFLLFLPYILAYGTTPSGSAFTGLLMNPEDSQTYFAKMLQGYDGAWLYRIPFTAERHEPAFLGGLYLALGHVSRVGGLSLESVWHGARVIADVAMFVTVYWFIAAYLSERRERLVAYLLALFGSGLGWLLFLINQPYWLGAFPVDFKMAEAHLFFTALTFPHVAIGTALLLISVRCLDVLLRACAETAASKTILVASLSNLLLVVAYPFLLYLLILIALLGWGVRAVQQRRILWPTTIRIATTFLLAAPLVAYYAWVLQMNVVFAAWDAQAGTPSPPWPHYLVSFGVMLLLAVAGERSWAREGEGHGILWWWVLAAALLVYAPLGPQRRFVQGLHVPLAILATVGAMRVVWPAVRESRLVQNLIRRPRYSERGLRRLFLALFLAVMSLSNLYVIASVSATAVWQQPYPLFRMQDEMAAVRWLRANSDPEEVVLGAYQTGNLVAARAGNYVVLGHWAETMDYESKVQAVAQFFAAETGDGWRREFLEEQHVVYAWYGPQEMELGDFEPRAADYLRSLATFGEITIYEVVGAP